MKGIKKISQLHENTNLLFTKLMEQYGDKFKQAANTLGYTDLTAISNNKSVLEKIESFLSDTTDRAKEIEDERKYSNNVKSLQDKAHELEDTTGQNDNDDEVSESRAKEIEDTINQMGKPKKLDTAYGDDLQSDNEEEEEEDIDLDEATVSRHNSSRRVHSFSSFIAEQEMVGPGGLSIPVKTGDSSSTAKEIEDKINTLGKTKTIIDDGEHISDEQKITQDVETAKDEPEVHGKVVVESHRRVLSFSSFLAEQETVDASGKDIGLHLGDGSQRAKEIEDKINTLGKNKTVIDDGEHISDEQKITQDAEIAKDEPEVHGKVVVESAEITSEDDFREYAITVLQKAHGSDFDQETADEMIDDLISTHGDDFGAMIGVLQNSLSESLNLDDRMSLKNVNNLTTEKTSTPIDQDIVDHVVRVVTFPIQPRSTAESIARSLKERTYNTPEELKSALNTRFGSNSRMRKYLDNAIKTLEDRLR